MIVPEISDACMKWSNNYPDYDKLSMAEKMAKQVLVKGCDAEWEALEDYCYEDWNKHCQDIDDRWYAQEGVNW